MSDWFKDDSVTRLEKDDLLFKNGIAPLQVVNQEWRTPKHLVTSGALNRIDTIRDATDS